MELKSRNMIQIEGVPPSVPAEPFRDVETIKAHRVPASIMHDPALIDSDEENWLDESDGNLLVVSPYRSRDHLLDLRALNTDQWLLAQALTALHNIRPDYATCPYAEAFNWSEVANNLRYLVRTAKYVWTDQHFYIVVFRSQITPTTNRSHLSDLDRISHVEAMKSGGLLKYWFGVTDEAGRNVATCWCTPRQTNNMRLQSSLY